MKLVILTVLAVAFAAGVHAHHKALSAIETAHHPQHTVCGDTQPCEGDERRAQE